MPIRLHRRERSFVEAIKESTRRIEPIRRGEPMCIEVGLLRNVSLEFKFVSPFLVDLRHVKTGIIIADCNLITNDLFKYYRSIITFSTKFDKNIDTWDTSLIHVLAK